LRRSETEILLDTLEAVRTVHVPTLIMYRVNVSWSKTRKPRGTLMSMVERLLELDWVENRPRGDRNFYYLTARGERALDAWLWLKSALEGRG